MGYESLAYVQKILLYQYAEHNYTSELVLGYGTTATIHLSKMYLLAML